MVNLERETGIEPATNSLEGCDSTTELLPPKQVNGIKPKFPATDTRPLLFLESPDKSFAGGERRIRTSVARKERQIYSLLPLTTRPSLLTICRMISGNLTYLELAKGLEPPTR